MVFAHLGECVQLIRLGRKPELCGPIAILLSLQEIVIPDLVGNDAVPAADVFHFLTSERERKPAAVPEADID